MSNQLDRFTERSLRTLRFAQHEALRLGNDQICPEHLLLAIMRVGDGIGASVLRNLGVELTMVRDRVDELAEPLFGVLVQSPTLAPSMKRVIELAVDEARNSGDTYIGTEHLLAGLVRARDGLACQLLEEMGIDLDAVHTELQRMPKEFSLRSSFSLRQIPRSISPVFGLIVLVTLAAGYAAYQKQLPPNLMVFAFVTGGWVLSLCLHEFAHALVAYLGGDEAVVDQGYLTLNPLKYTHVVLSIGLPLLYLAMGGIGLPGGAVYINRHAIRSKAMRSLVSAAGPMATALCAVTLLIPFAVTTQAIRFNHLDYWAGMAVLAWLQVSALVLNLLPIPGLDGFGIISPYLPDKVTASIRGFGSYTLVFIFVLFSNVTFRQGFWGTVEFLSSFFYLDVNFVYEGFRLFRFWVR